VPTHAMEISSFVAVSQMTVFETATKLALRVCWRCG
jgi:hypothetical protein